MGEKPDGTPQYGLVDFIRDESGEIVYDEDGMHEKILVPLTEEEEHIHQTLYNEYLAEQQKKTTEDWPESSTGTDALDSQDNFEDEASEEEN